MEGQERGRSRSYQTETQDQREDDGRQLRRHKATERAPISCELCKSRKVRCDRVLPACGRCMRSDQTCGYATKKKPGLRAGYGKQLESRLDRLEGVLQAQQHVLTKLSSRLGVDMPSTGAHAPIDYSAADDLPTDSENVNQDRTAAADASPATQDTYLSPQSSLAAGQNFSAASPASLAASHTVQPPIAMYDAASTASFEGQNMLPPDLLYSLTNLYFDHVNPWCPLLHRQTTLSQLFGASSLEEEDYVLLHAIVTTTMRFSQDERLRADVREWHHTHSKNKILLHGMDASSIKSLQALVILAFDAVGTSNGPPSWNLLALITKNVVRLGLTAEEAAGSSTPAYPSISTLRANELSEPDNFIEGESRRRLFWAAYLLDRFATVATAFSFGLDEQEVHRRLPCREDLFDPKRTTTTPSVYSTLANEPMSHHLGNVGAFGHYIQVIGILSKIHLFLRKPINIGSESDVLQWQSEYRELDRTLLSWRAALPSHLQDLQHFNSHTSPDVNSLLVMLHITYYMTTIRLHSSAAYPTHRSQLFSPSSSASQRCLSAVEKISEISSFANNTGLLPRLGPHFAFCIWVAARLLLVHGSTVDHHVNPAIVALVDALRKLGQYWDVASRYCNLLQRVLDEYHESAHTDGSVNGDSNAPSSVRILADMRRCAYDLDLLISRQPRLQSDPARINITAADPSTHNELEYLDVFDFFNLPRLPSDDYLDLNGLQTDSVWFSMADSQLDVSGSLADSNHDWLNEYESL